MTLHIEKKLSKTGINTNITEPNFNDAMMYTKTTLPHVYVLGRYSDQSCSSYVGEYMFLLLSLRSLRLQL